MRSYVLKCILTFGLLPASGYSDWVDDLFTQVGCAAAVERAAIVSRVEHYWSAGKQLGYRDEELRAYVARRTRALLLFQVAQEKIRESGVAKAFADTSDLSLLKPFTFSRSIISVHPPKNRIHLEIFQKLMVTRAAMAGFRFRLEVALGKFPKFLSLPSQIIEAQRIADKTAQEFRWERRGRLFYQNSMWMIENDLGVVDRSTLDFNSRAQSLYAQYNIPMPVIKEISDEVNFQSLYQLRMNVYQKLFLVMIERYFEK